MPRISQTQEIAGLGVSDALEWVNGDSATFEGLWETDEDPPQPVDLTGAAIEIVFVYAFATVRQGANARGNRGDDLVNISNIVRDATQTPRTIACTVLDQAVTANVGRFDWFLPTDLDARDPALDIQEQVPVIIAYLTRRIGSETLTERFAIIIRRGPP